MRYTADYRFEGRAWIVQFRELDIATFGRSLGSAKQHARSLLAVFLEIDDLKEAGVEVVDEVRLPGGLAGDVDRLTARRSEAEMLRVEVAEATRHMAANLRRAGFSTRDVGEILQISGARVAQIEREIAAT